MTLMIGTAQFGRDYGIANQTGRVPYDEVLKILSLAAENGVVHIDTSSDYGQAEKIIGQAKEELDLNIKVTTKLYREFDKEEPTEIVTGMECSLERLKIGYVDSLLVHDPHWLMDDKISDYVYGMLMVLKGKGYTKKIGVSVGEPRHATEILEKYRLDVVQAPLNLLDQRLLEPDVVDRLRGAEIHTRSVFLQGLLLMDPETLPEYFSPIKDRLLALRSFADKNDVSMLKLCLDFVDSALFEKTIVGVDSVRQLQDILDAYRTPKCQIMPHGSWINNNPKFINPGLWPIGGWWK